MHSQKIWNRLLLLALCFGIPESVHAAGGIDIQLMFLSLITVFWPLWVTIAVLVLVIAGFTLMTSQDEGRLQKAKTTLISVLTGGILTTIILVIGPTNFLSIVYTGNPYGMDFYSAVPATIVIESVGIAKWLSAIAVMMGVLFIIIAVLRAVASLGDEAAYTSARTALFHVIVGVILIGGAFIVELAFFGSANGPGQVVTRAMNIEPNPLIGLISLKLLIIIQIILLIAVLILVYAGIRMIASFGREEDFTAAKSLMIRVFVGILVLMLSYSLVFIVAKIFS